MLKSKLYELGYMTPLEYSKSHYISRTTVYKMMHTGKLDVKKCGDGRYFVRDKEDADK